MAVSFEFGRVDSDRPQTLTLRQYQKTHGNCPKQSHVKLIFKPGKLPYWTLVTDHDFKVVVGDNHPLHATLSERMESFIKDETLLVVGVDNAEKGQWSLGTDTDRKGLWEEKSWGYTIALDTTPKSRKRNTSP